MTSSLFSINKAIKEGSLKKRSPHKLGQATWSVRYVVLYEDALVYYSAKDAPKPRGVLPLQYVITANLVTDSDKAAKSELPPNCHFEVAIRCSPSMKMFHWAASSEQEAISWVQEIKRVSEIVKVAQAKDPYETFSGPPSPRFWKDVVGLGVARARAAKEKAKNPPDEKAAAATTGIGSPRVPRSASAPQGMPYKESPEEKTHSRSASGEGIFYPQKLGAQAAVPQAPVLSGVLSKRSPRGLKLWQKRHFSLFPDLLVYSKTEGSRIVGAVPLECVESVSIIEITEGASSFNIVLTNQGTSNPKTLEIMAASPEECTTWVEALHRACPNTLQRIRKSVGGPPHRARDPSMGGMVRSASNVIEFDLSTPYVDKSESPIKPKLAHAPVAYSPKSVTPVALGIDLTKAPPKPPPRAGSLIAVQTHPSSPTNASGGPRSPRALAAAPAPSRPPPPPPTRKTTSIEGVSPSLVTPVAPIFAPDKQKNAHVVETKQEAPRVAPVLTAEALPNPMDEAPPDYTSSSDEDDDMVIARESVVGSIYTPESITTVTTFYRHKNTDSSDSEDYVLIDLDGDDNKLEDSLPTFLPQASVATRKVSQSSWTAIHHNPAEYSPKLQATKHQSPDMVDHDVLTLGPRLVSTNSRPPSPTREAKADPPSLPVSDYPSFLNVDLKSKAPQVKSAPPPPKSHDKPPLHPDPPKQPPSAPERKVDPKPSEIPKPSETHKPPEPKPSEIPKPTPLEIPKSGDLAKGKDALVVGDYVELFGLSASKYNTQKGVVILTDLNRCEIRLTSGDVVRIKEINLKKIPKPKMSPRPRGSASEAQLEGGIGERGSASRGGMVRQQSSPKLREELKVTSQKSKIPRLADHKRALSQPPKAGKAPTEGEVPKPFLADDEGDTEDEQLSEVQETPEWVKNRMFTDSGKSLKIGDPRAKPPGVSKDKDKDKKRP